MQVFWFLRVERQTEDTRLSKEILLGSICLEVPADKRTWNVTIENININKYIFHYSSLPETQITAPKREKRHKYKQVLR